MLTKTPNRQTAPPPSEPSFVDIYAEFAGPPFPLDTLPPTLAAFVDAQHRNTGADPSALAMAALACVAGATHAETMVLAGEGWWERPILWVFLIGLPSMKKTPTVKKTMKPLVLIDHERRKTGKQELAAWKQTNQGEKQKGKLPPPRLRPRCIIRDITPEKVAEILSREPCGSMLVRDELAGWIANFERYNSDARGFYLETWDGGTSGKDRVGRGARDEDAEIHIENLALCILGGIQPDKLVALGDLTSDGLLQRGLPCLMQAAKRGDQYYSVAKVEAAYDKLLKSINAQVLPEKYLFDQDAMKVRDRVNDKLFELEQLDGFSDALIGAIGKLNGYFARICLVLEVAKQHDPAGTGLPGWTLANSERIDRLLEGLDNKSLGAGVNARKAISRETAGRGRQGGGACDPEGRGQAREAATWPRRHLSL